MLRLYRLVILVHLLSVQYYKLHFLGVTYTFNTGITFNTIYIYIFFKLLFLYTRVPKYYYKYLKKKKFVKNFKWERINLYTSGMVTGMYY